MEVMGKFIEIRSIPVALQVSQKSPTNTRLANITFNPQNRAIAISHLPFPSQKPRCEMAYDPFSTNIYKTGTMPSYEPTRPNIARNFYDTPASQVHSDLTAVTQQGTQTLPSPPKIDTVMAGTQAGNGFSLVNGYGGAPQSQGSSMNRQTINGEDPEYIYGFPQSQDFVVSATGEPRLMQIPQVPVASTDPRLNGGIANAGGGMDPRFLQALFSAQNQAPLVPAQQPQAQVQPYAQMQTVVSGQGNADGLASLQNQGGNGGSLAVAQMFQNLATMAVSNTIPPQFMQSLMQTAGRLVPNLQQDVNTPSNHTGQGKSQNVLAQVPVGAQAKVGDPQMPNMPLQMLAMMQDSQGQNNVSRQQPNVEIPQIQNIHVARRALMFPEASLFNGHIMAPASSGNVQQLLQAQSPTYLQNLMLQASTSPELSQAFLSFISSTGAQSLPMQHAQQQIIPSPTYTSQNLTPPRRESGEVGSRVLSQGRRQNDNHRGNQKPILTGLRESNQQPLKGPSNNGRGRGNPSGSQGISKNTEQKNGQSQQRNLKQCLGPIGDGKKGSQQGPRRSERHTAQQKLQGQPGSLHHIPKAGNRNKDGSNQQQQWKPSGPSGRNSTLNQQSRGRQQNVPGNCNFNGYKSPNQQPPKQPPFQIKHEPATQHPTISASKVAMSGKRFKQHESLIHRGGHDLYPSPSRPTTPSNSKGVPNELSKQTGKRKRRIPSSREPISQLISKNKASEPSKQGRKKRQRGRGSQSRAKLEADRGVEITVGVVSRIDQDSVLDYGDGMVDIKEIKSEPEDSVGPLPWIQSKLEVRKTTKAVMSDYDMEEPEQVLEPTFKFDDLPMYKESTEPKPVAEDEEGDSMQPILDFEGGLEQLDSGVNGRSAQETVAGEVSNVCFTKESVVEEREDDHMDLVAEYESMVVEDGSAIEEDTIIEEDVTVIEDDPSVVEDVVGDEPMAEEEEDLMEFALEEDYVAQEDNIEEPTAKTEGSISDDWVLIDKSSVLSNVLQNMDALLKLEKTDKYDESKVTASNLDDVLNHMNSTFKADSTVEVQDHVYVDEEDFLAFSTPESTEDDVGDDHGEESDSMEEGEIKEG